MSIFLGNAFPLQMINTSVQSTVQVSPVSADIITDTDFISVVGHADTANVLSGILGRPVEMNRQTIKLAKGDILFVAQVVGGRLPEGTTTLPEGMSIVFLKVELA